MLQCKDIIFTFVKIIQVKFEKIRDIMKDRIAHIMRAKNLKASDFAALLGIQPSGISHILSGRNQPSLEFVKKIKETFPEYNLDWIIFGTGPITTSEQFQPKPVEPLPDTQLEIEPVLDTTPQPQPQPSMFSPSTSTINGESIKTLFVLYADGSFETFNPR